MIAPPYICASNLSVRLGGALILDDISLALTPGSMSVLLGPNGSGKTTLIRALAGVIHPHRGKITLGGVPLRQLDRSMIARHCAYLPQQTAANFDIRVEDAVALGRYSHTGSWGMMNQADYEIVAWAMERVGLTKLRQRVLPTLSGGERQRVFIARALAQQSPILLLDEPIASLDIGRQLELMMLLKELHSEGRTVLAALHDLRPALEFFPNAFLLHAGRLVAADATDNVIFGPALEAAFDVQVHRADELSFRHISKQ